MRSPRTPYRGNAVAVGVLLIACSAAAILSAVPLGSMLDVPVDLARLAAGDNRVIAAALIEFIWAATGAGVAIGLYPVLRKRNRALALGAVAGRVVEGALVLAGTLSLLVLLTLSQQAAAGSAGSPALEATVNSLLAARHWVQGFLILLPWLAGAALYYYLLYRTRLIPRWLSGWGLVAVALSLAATVYSGFTQDFGFSTLNTVLNIPIGVQEIVLAVWLIAKGFSAPAVIGEGTARVDRLEHGSREVVGCIVELDQTAGTPTPGPSFADDRAAAGDRGHAEFGEPLGSGGRT